MEKLPHHELNGGKEKFEEYKEYFGLSEDDLKKSILDVGAGSGDFVKYMRETLGNQRVFGIEKLGKEIRMNSEGMVQGDMVALPFDDDSFELVLAKHSLTMTMEKPRLPESALRELLRVAQPKGYIRCSITTPEWEESILKNDIHDYKIGSRGYKEFLSRMTQRIEGARQLAQFLSQLRESGVAITYDGEIVTIQKPDSPIHISEE